MHIGPQNVENSASGRIKKSRKREGLLGFTRKCPTLEMHHSLDPSVLPEGVRSTALWAETGIKEESEPIGVCQWTMARRIGGNFLDPKRG